MPCSSLIEARRSAATSIAGRGGGRLATVIDSEDGLWKVPEEALTPSNEPRRTTMMTPQDAARATWRVGDKVAFAGPAGEPHTGKIAKLNPTQARVRAGRALWNVPYGGLRRAGAGEEPARNGAEQPEQCRRDGPRPDGRA